MCGASKGRGRENRKRRGKVCFLCLCLCLCLVSLVQGQKEIIGWDSVAVSLCTARGIVISTIAGVERENRTHDFILKRLEEGHDIDLKPQFVSLGLGPCLGQSLSATVGVDQIRREGYPGQRQVAMFGENALPTRE